jgi:hypothetical protein
MRNNWRFDLRPYRFKETKRPSLKRLNMSLNYILDGCNIAHHSSFRILNSHGKDSRILLIELVKEKLHKHKVKIVFDGWMPDTANFNSGGNFGIIFSQDHSADEWIKNMLEASKNNANTIVVSDDRQVRDFAKLSRASTYGVEEFISVLVKKTAVQRPDDLKPELGYSEKDRINQELKEKWKIS